MVEGTPPGDALPPPPQRATPARKGARCGAGAGPPHPHLPHPGHAGRGTLAARSGGRAAGGGTAPGTKRPSQRWKAAPPGDALPPPPQRATPARKGARCGAGAGSTRPHRPHPGHTGRGTLAARSGGRAAGGGTAPDTRRPSQRWKAPPPGTPFRHPHSEQRRPARAHAVGPVLGPHAHTDRTRDTRVAEPWLHAPEDGRPGEGQRLAPSAPHNGGRQPPPGTPFRHPHSEQRRPARAHAVGPVLGPHARIDRTRGRRVAEPWLHAPADERPGEGQRLTPGAPHNGGRHPPGDALPPPPQRATPARKGASCGAGAGSTRPHRPHPGHTGRGTLAARSGGRAAGRGTAPDTRRPSQRWKAPPPGTPFRHPHSEQRRPARAHAVGPVLGPHARIDRTRDTRVAEPWLRAPEDEQPGEGQRLTPGAPHNGGRHPPQGRPSATPIASNASPQGRTLWGRCWVHTPASTAPGTHRSRTPSCTLRRTSGRGRDSACHQAPLTTVEGTPPGDALPPPPQRATPARKGARCGAGAGSTRPHQPRPGHAGRGTLAARSRGRAAGGGTAPDTRRPSQRWKAPPPGTPFRHPPSEQRQPARAHAVGPVLGPHARIDRTRDTRVAEPWLHAPEDERPGKGQRLTPGAPHNGGRHPPRGRPSATPTASNAGPQGRTLRGRCWVHTPASTAPGTHGSRNPGCTLQRTSGRGRDSA